MTETYKHPREFPFPPTVVVGVGRLGKALLRGMEIFFSRDDHQRIIPLPLITVDRHLYCAFGGTKLVRSIEELPTEGFIPQVIILAVRPSQVKEVIYSLAEKYKDLCSSDKLTLVSCVVGVSIDQLTNLWRQYSDSIPHIVRVMPTILISQRQGISFFYHEGKNVYPIKLVKDLFSYLSNVIEVRSEFEMDLGISLVSALMGVVCNITSIYEQFLLNADYSEKDAKELIAEILVGMGKLSINPLTREPMSLQIETPGGITEAMMKVFHSKASSRDLFLDMLRVGMEKISDIKDQIEFSGLLQRQTNTRIVFE